MTTSDAPTDAELERTAGRTWFVGGTFVGFGVSPAVAVAIYAIAALFVEGSLAAVLVLAAALLSFCVGLGYVALARTIEP